MKGIIYKITCDTGKFYIGSTIKTLRDRMSRHKANCKRLSSYALYYHINEIGGWDHVSVEVLEEVEVETLHDLHYLESIYLRPLIELCDCLNDIDAYRTKQEKNQYDKEYLRGYRQDNREALRKKAKEYYAKKKAAKALICLIE